MHYPTTYGRSAKRKGGRRVTGLYIKEIDSLSTPYFSKTFAYIA
jgi:hypothetical protein